MTLLHADDRVYLTSLHAERYALGPPDAPLVLLNAADDAGCAWLAVTDGWDAPDVSTPLDRRPDGHGGYVGGSSFDPLTLSVEGAVTAPDRPTLRAAKARLMGALLGDLTGFLRYTHLDDDPAKGVWVRISGQPKWRAVDDRAAEFAFVVVSEDPIKTGARVTYGPVRLTGTASEGGRTYPRSYPRGYVGLATLTETRRNLILNPAPASTAWWSANAATATLVSGKLRLTTTAAATTPTSAYLYANAGPTGAANRFPVSGGQPMACRVEVTNPNAAAVTVRGILQGYTWTGTAWTSVGAFVSGAWVTVAAGATVTLELLGTVPAGTAATHILPLFYMAGATSTTAPTTGTLYDFTRAALYIGAGAPTATPVPYLDGDTPDTVTLNYGWAGTANASQSVEQTVTFAAAGAPAVVVAYAANPGDESAHAVYRIGGPLPQPLVQVSTGEVIHLTLDLAAQDTARVDTADGTVQVNGVNRYDAWGPGSTFPLIPPGGAEVRLRSVTGGADPAAALYVDTAPSWR